jgi:hypothetical protein
VYSVGNMLYAGARGSYFSDIMKIQHKRIPNHTNVYFVHTRQSREIFNCDITNIEL